MREEIIAWTMVWEGCFSLAKSSKNQKGTGTPYYRPSLQITNTNKELLDRFQQVVGCGKIDLRVKEDRKMNCKAKYAWRVNTQKDIKNICESILPFLPAKKEQAELLLEYCILRLNTKLKGVKLIFGETTRTKREEEIYKRIKELNKRGVR